MAGADFVDANDYRLFASRKQQDVEDGARGVGMFHGLVLPSSSFFASS